MNHLLESSKSKVKWPPSVRKLLAEFPAAPASSNWQEMIRLCSIGKLEAARALAINQASRNNINHRNIIARRLRIERVAFFSRITAGERELRGLLADYTGNLGKVVSDKGHKLANLKLISAKIHTETVILRSRMRMWFSSLIKDSTKMGFAHAGDALIPIFNANKRPAMEQSILAERAIFEARLVFGLSSTLAGQANPRVALDAQKWRDAQAAIYKVIVKKNLQGLTPSEKIWDLTTRTEQDLKRIVANGIANSENPTSIARKIERYVAPGKQSSLGVEVGAGVYRSPYKNAMRLARTEMNRSYASATSAFAKEKDWVQGLQITLSPLHTEDDECSDAAGQVVSPEEFAQMVPFHPHCMCYGTYVIDPKYLGEEDPAQTPPEEE